MGRKWGRTALIHDEYMDSIARDFEGGAELREIAVKYEVSPPTITNWLIAAGYKHRQKGRYPQAMKDRAVDLTNRGWDHIAIANLFKTKLSYVDEWVSGSGSVLRVGVVGKRGAPMEVKYKRHVVGHRWTDAQKKEVLRLLSSGVFSVDQIYRLTNASRVRQQRIWAEAVESPFPLPKERRPRWVAPEEEEEEEQEEEEEVREVGRVEAFQQGRLEGVKEARRLALAAGDEGQATALVPLTQRFEAQSDDEIEEEFKRFEAQKRLLDEGP